MKLCISKLAIILFLVVMGEKTKAQITYLELRVDQPNVEDCLTYVETNFKLENIKVYPKSTEGLIIIKAENLGFTGELKIVIYNIKGQSVYAENTCITDTKLEKHIDLSSNPTGIYLLNVSLKNRYYREEIILQ